MENEKWVVYTEFLPELERWYYGVYNDRNYANEVALDFNYKLSRDANYSYCVCPASEAREFGIKNLPAGL